MTDIFSAGGTTTPTTKLLRKVKQFGFMAATGAAQQAGKRSVGLGLAAGQAIGEGISAVHDQLTSDDQPMLQEESPATAHAQLLAQVQQGKQHTTKMPGVRKVNR